MLAYALIGDVLASQFEHIEWLVTISLLVVYRIQTILCDQILAFGAIHAIQCDADFVRTEQSWNNLNMYRFCCLLLFF